MVHSRHFSKIIIVVTAIAVLLCFGAIAYSEELNEKLGGTGVSMEYETKLFDTDEIMEIDIRMDEDTWNQMLNNAMAEEYYVCDVVINGLKVSNVAIRPKGNTSLSAIAMDPTTDRYSLKLEFDHFVDGQTCYGLDKLILNNNYADATNMKEAVIYDMFQYLGADASLYNYAKVSVNGTYWGVYLALEGVEESFMLRNFGTQDGELYKPDTMEMGGNSGSAGSSGGNSGSRGGGANLNYTNDELSSYQTIWDSALTGTTDSDHKRVVTAFKNISAGTDLETYLDVDNVLRYMAVHTFSVNMDSLSGSMSHNYYLYEYKGQLNIFPWDYNLSLGGMSMGSSGNATDMVNDAIDTPFSGTKFFDSLLANEEYLEKYHSYLKQLTDAYVDGGRFDEVYNRIRSQIDSLVETDPTAFYTYEEYENAAEILYETVKLRAESIQGQLAGTIPSTDAGQRQDKTSLVDASHINVKEMGQFSMGGSKSGDGEEGGGGFSFPGGSMPDGFDPSSMGGFDPSSMGGFDPSSMGGFDPSSMGDFDPNNMPDGFDPGSMGGRGGSSFPGGKGGNSSEGDKDADAGDGSEKDSQETGQKSSDSKSSGRNSPSSFNGNFSGAPNQNGKGLSATAQNLIIYGVCLMIILAAMLFASIGKKRKYRKM